MKKYLLLLAIFAFCSVYIFFKSNNEDNDSSGEGDAPIHEHKATVLGGVVENPKNDTIKISELQVSYVSYVKGNITYDEMVEQNMENLKHVLNYPFNPKKGYLFSSGFDEHSKIQIYYQSDQEETRTVVFKVVYGEDENKVTKIYDGGYLKLVAVDDENPQELLIYDGNNEESKLVIPD